MRGCSTCVCACRHEAWRRGMVRGQRQYGSARVQLRERVVERLQEGAVRHKVARFACTMCSMS